MAKNAIKHWDAKSIQRAAEATTLDVTVTSINRIFSDGRPDDDRLLGGWRDQFEAHGILHGPRLIVVELHCSGESRDSVGQIGFVRFNTLSPVGGSIALPQLDVHFNDADGRILRVMCEAHRDALASGQTSFGVRFFKRRDAAGVITNEVLADGYSSKSAEILGFVI
jgi:hypothetical protein